MVENLSYAFEFLFISYSSPWYIFGEPKLRHNEESKHKIASVRALNSFNKLNIQNQYLCKINNSMIICANFNFLFDFYCSFSVLQIETKTNFEHSKMMESKNFDSISNSSESDRELSLSRGDEEQQLESKCPQIHANQKRKISSTNPAQRKISENSALFSPLFRQVKTPYLQNIIQSSIISTIYLLKFQFPCTKIFALLSQQNKSSTDSTRRRASFSDRVRWLHHWLLGNFPRTASIK